MSPSESLRWLSRRPLILFIATLIAYAVITFALGWRSGRWSEAIYFATGAVLIWYTVETHAMRREMTRQNALQVQPFVFVTAIQSNPDAVVLRNIGRGAALHVRVEDVEFLVDGATVPEFVAKFATADVIEAGADVRATADLVRSKDSKRIFDFASSLDPRYQKRLDIPVVITYQDMHRGHHRTDLTMGKSGTRLVHYA